MIEAVIGLVGVIVGSAITVFKESWTSWRNRRRSGAYAAIRITCLLEEYADKCVDVVQDDGTAYGRPAGRTADGEEFYEVQVQRPDAPSFPDDIDWRSLDISLMHRILGLPNKARRTDRYIDENSEHSFPPFYSEMFEARQLGYAELGIEALQIAADLRMKYKIEANVVRIGDSDWDAKKFLMARSKALEEKARNASNLPGKV